ncbi:PREDICTED: fer-1-like protein 4 [Pygoscelis adeliae]|uniref:fer-1-like protein 4 n=1 Tax=Pygoscelis adeliae TaxID=9238 RepID=UPI0004F5077A|nr:PREDICTED: fer-1-like protein 4 [Pygoscelis adeliae]
MVCVDAGFTQKTRKIRCGPEAVFGELFRWPHYGKLVMGEMLSIKVYNCSKVFSNRLLGTLVLSLQHLMTSGRLILREALVDMNHRVTGIYIELDLRYQPPNGSAGTWVEEDFVYQMKDSSELIIRNPGFEELEAAEGPRASELDRRAATLGRKLAKGLETDEEEEDEEEDFYDLSEMEVSGIVFSPVKSRSRLCSAQDLFATPIPQSFQVGINIIEAQKLVGVNINPFVVVKVGEEKRHTATQKSTNCPFYNEYFLFEFHEPRDILFHRLIEISVFHSKKIPFLGTCIGTFKMDVVTVYSQPDHRFFQKWAVISDPMDTRAGVKGFVKCNISVTARGEVVGSLPTSSSSQDEDIERNLLLPKRVPAERPWARVCVKLYRAEGLPSMSAGIMGGFSKIIGEKKVFIDPYVQVSFCGQQGETSVETNTTDPEWNEQISFIEMFPPLARKIKVQVLDDANVGDVAIATHYIDLQQISDSGRNGFNPTFGPAWVNLYGSPQNSALRDIHKDLNEGMGEGIFYRGRILMAITVEIFSSPSVAERKLGDKTKGALSKLKLKKKSKKSKEKAKELSQLQGEEAGGSQETEQPGEVTVEVEELHPLPENALGRKEEFLLFAAFFEATMMDSSLSSKPVSFEVSIGNYGKAEEVVTKVWRKKEKGEVKEEKQPLLDPGSDGELDVEVLAPASAALNKSVTNSQRPEPMEYDRSYSCLPMMHEKPCVYVWSYWEDHTWRLCISNWIVKLAERLEQGLDDVEKLMRRPKTKAEERLREVLEEFVAGCRQYLLSTERKTMAHPNNLDRCRMKYLMRNIILYAKQGLRMRRRLTRANVKEKVKETRRVLTKLRFMAKEGSPEFLGQAFAVPQVKLVDEPYTKPALQFFDFYKGSKAVGELIATFELMELDYSGYLEPSVPEDVEPKEPDYLGDPHAGRFIIPEGIRPVLKEFRIEILFWGLRDLKRVNLFEVDQPQVIIECAGKKVESEVIMAYKENPNFTELVKYMDVDLPEQVYLHPPLSIFVVEKRAFGRTVLVGTHVVSDVMKFSPRELEEDPEDVPKAQKVSSQRLPSQTVVNIGPAAGDPGLSTHPLSLVKAPLKKIPINKLVKKEDEYEEEKPELEELDWWSKYYESLKELYNQTRSDEEDAENDDLNDTDGGNLNASSIDMEAEDEAVIEAEPARPKRKLIATLQIYNSELENEFDNFEDWLCIFPLHRGKANEDEDGKEDEHFVGKYKGSFYVYPTEEAGTEPRVSEGIPRNRPIKVLVRVYIVKATNLSPADPNGKADPYVVVTVGQEQKDTKERYIPKQLNPVFGEVVELTVSFPMESELTVAIFDHDLVGSDDLIGETKIDLENRFYSKHRANCGVASQYDINGYNMWRDAFKPTQILDSLCKKNSLPAAEYRREEVKMDNKIFKVPPEAFPEEASVRNKRRVADENWSVDDEHKALYVLQHWEEMPGYGYKLVPEHVEIRSLYNPENPGLVQGSLHMWIDMFPNDVPAPPPVNIKPRLPVSYELRVIIWNTDDVILDDVNPVTGEPSSDIYVKSWIKGLDHDKQETDVHFNSLTGEGNFNWRFIFRFNYLPTEKEITYKKKDSVFSVEESEFREPAVLVLQVWDYDRISANDFLGSIELKLHDMVRAAKSSEHCTIKMAKENATPRFSIFRNKRMRGWWPFIKLKDQEDEEREEREDKQKKKKKKWSSSVKPEDVEFTDPSGNKYLLTGKVEAEFQLLTVEEAEKSPVGLGRKEPEPLEKPNRPKTSFNWFVNPMKTFVFFIWKRYKKYIVVLFVVAVLTIFLVLLIYTMPGYISEKIING